MEVKTENAVVANESPYLLELKEELKKLSPEDFAHATRFLNEECKRVESGDKYKNVTTLELHHDRPSSNAIKIRIPVREFPKYNFVGKLLGPKGNTLKQLQQETGCKLSILGRGSMRDKNKEEELRKEGGKYAHLNEELHLMVECFAERLDAYSRLAHALSEVKKFMVPDMGGQDDYEGGRQDDMGGYYNGDNGGMGRGGHRGGPAPGRGGLLSTPGRGGAMAGPPRGGGSMRGGPAPRGAPAPGGAPAPRGALAPRGGPSSRGGPPPRSAPPAPMRSSAPPGGGVPRGAPPTRTAPPSRGSHGAPMSAPRGGMPSSRGRGMSSLPPVSRAPPQQDYEDYHSAPAYEPEPTYAQESHYEESYSRRDPYAEEPAYSTQSSAGGEPQYFDYGHGAGSTGYSEYETAPASSGYERSALKAQPAQQTLGGRGTYRSHPYEMSRSAAPRPAY